MKKYIFSSFFASFFILGLFILSSTQNCASAKTYGPTAVCPADPTKTVSSFYPGQSISSSDIYVTILGQGVPAGIRFQAGASAPACSAVQCLARSGGGISGPLSGDRTGVTIDTLGCGGTGSGCTDTATVSVGAYDTITGFQCTWHVSPNGAPGSFSPGNSATVVLANGTPSSVYFMLICTPTAVTNTPTKSPTPTPTKSPTPTPTKSPTPTPTKSPTPTVTLPPNFTPTVTTPPVCPVPAKPVVTVNCPICDAN